MPLRDLVADKPNLTKHGFNFIGTNGTIEFKVGKTKYHISIHGDGRPVQWDRYHVKIYDERFGPQPAASFAVYFQIANTEGTILAQDKGVVRPAELEAVKTAIGGYLGG